MLADNMSRWISDTCVRSTAQSNFRSKSNIPTDCKWEMNPQTLKNGFKSSIFHTELPIQWPLWTMPTKILWRWVNLRVQTADKLAL